MGLCPTPRGVVYIAPSDLLAVFEEPTSKTREGAGGEGRGIRICSA